MVNPTQRTNLFTEFKREDIEQSISDRFEQQVRLHPSRLAVKGKNLALTYETLNRMANRIAWTILAQRDREPEPVGILLEPEAMSLAAILGVLKAGKIWVPVDPGLTRARIAHMLADGQIKLVITDTEYAFLAEQLSNGRPLVIIDRLDASVAEENPALPISPEALAYILYTSGSTGEPKGVAQNHRTFLHAIRCQTNSLRICADDRLSLLASHSYLAGVTATCRALLNGGVLLPYYLRKQGTADLARWLRQEEITICQIVPTLFRHLVETLRGDETFPKLRLLHLGGEPVSRHDVELYRKHCAPDCILLINLGSTEVLTYRQYFISKASHISNSIVPVGYSVEDKEVLLLDEAGQSVRCGEVGEIAVRSRYLTPGYWGRPELTQTLFTPVLDQEGVRIFRTGDLGRMLPDGCLEHLGRKDFQVKIRGHRIELGEIEMALLAHPQVKEAVVVAREDRAGDMRLVAYIVPAQEPVPTSSALRRFVREKLPEYMVPSTFVALQALPLTPNGKVDRRALPPPSPVRPDLDTPFMAPRTPIEEELAQIWAETLSVDQVGIHDNFFDLGGHSLAATRVISQVIKKFHLEISLESLFQSPTVATMAAVITASQAKKLGEKDLDRILVELESLSEEDARRLLSAQSMPASTED